MPQTKRLLWVDALNVLACAGVLLLHCTNYQIHEFNGKIDFEFYTALFSHTFFIWPVNVFFMITGYTLIRPGIINPENTEGIVKFYKRRLARILIPILFWNLIYCALNIYGILKSGQSLDPMIMLSKFFLLQYNQTMWFFVPLIGIYICLPFIAVMMTHMSRSMQQWFVILGFILVGILPTATACAGNLTWANLFPIGGSYIYIAILGYYFGNQPISHRAKVGLVVLSACSIAAMWILRYYTIPENITTFKPIVAYLSPLCIILSITVFIVVKDYIGKHYDYNTAKESKGSKLFERILHKASPLSFGVYLSQILIIIIIQKFIPQIPGILLFIIAYPSTLLLTYIFKKIPLLQQTV